MSVASKKRERRMRQGVKGLKSTKHNRCRSLFSGAFFHALKPRFKGCSLLRYIRTVSHQATSVTYKHRQ